MVAMNYDLVEGTGVSGLNYVYYRVRQGLVWPDIAGNYMFCGWNGQAWIAQYMGECESFNTRMPPKHERWAEAIGQYGVTDIFYHVNQAGEAARQREERDLIQAYNPPMN